MVLRKKILRVLLLAIIVVSVTGGFAQKSYANHPWAILPHTDSPTGKPGKFRYQPDGSINVGDPFEIPPEGCFFFLYENYESGGATVRQGYLSDPAIRSEILGCALKTGKIHAAFIPFYVLHVSNLLVFAAGLISVLFLIIGGYQYIVGGVTGNTEKGKKTVFYAVIGLVVVILSFFIVNVIQIALTTPPAPSATSPGTEGGS